MKRIGSLFLALSLSPLAAQAANISPRTLAEAEQYDAEHLQEYHQEKYQLTDPAGDYALLRRSQLVPNRIFLALGGKQREKKVIVDTDEDYEGGEPELEKKDVRAGKSDIELLQAYCERQPREAALFKSVFGAMGIRDEEQLRKLSVAIENIGKPIQGRENPLLREGFKRMFAQVINEERENGIEPAFGTPHEWSKEFLDKYRETSTMLASSKLLMALAVGDTNRYMRTDQEADLYRWMVGHPESSLTIPEVFRKSYQLNKGDIYKTLLTIENVLSHQRNNPRRENLPLTQRLKPITSGHEYSQDRYGSWYHLFGIMLYGYVEGGTKAHVIGRIEALGSKILSPGVLKTQKTRINKTGGLLGGDLADMVRERSFTTIKSDARYLDEASYLNRTEDFRDRINVALSPDTEVMLDRQPERSFLNIRNRKKDLRNCTVEVMPSIGLGFDSSLKETSPAAEIGKDGTMIQIFTPNVQKVRGFITCEGEAEPLVFESN